MLKMAKAIDCAETFIPIENSNIQEKEEVLQFSSCLWLVKTYIKRAQMKWCREPRCSPRVKLGCQGTFGVTSKVLSTVSNFKTERETPLDKTDFLFLAGF